MTVERVMLVLPNLNIIAGCDDTERFEEWWVSEPLPVREIKELEWAGGEVGLAICVLPNGRDAVFRSEGGRRWSEAISLPEGVEALGFARIDYGWILLMASDGWYETTDSGVTWQKVSSDAPGCRRAIRISESILLAHDGSRIWRSLDLGRSWHLSLDCRDLADGSIVYPALDGIYDMVFAGAGSRILLSEDQGGSWTVDHSFTRPVSVVNVFCLDRPGDQLPEFILETLDHSTGYFRIYYRDGDSSWIPRMDQRAIADTRNLGASRVQRPGSDQLRTLCFSTATRWNPQRRTYEPSLYFSTDGGLTWRWIDILKTHTSPGTPFVIEKFTYKVKVWAPCHNYWYWEERYGYRKGLSWDAGLAVKHPTRERQYPGGIAVAKRFYKTISPRLVTAARFKRGYVNRLAVQDTFDALLTSRAALRDTFETASDHSVALAWRLTTDYSPDMVAKKAQRMQYWTNTLTKGEAEHGASAGIIIVSSKFEDVESDVERDFPQVFDITCTRRMRSLGGV